MGSLSVVLQIADDEDTVFYMWRVKYHYTQCLRHNRAITVDTIKVFAVRKQMEQ